MHQENLNHLHIPVLAQEVCTYLDPKRGDRYLDLTAGYGGHADMILEQTKDPSGAVLIDRDHHAIAALQKRFAGQGIQLLHTDFLTASRRLQAEGRQFDVILADLGVSSPHLNQASRGFSIKADGPLDMRMDQTQHVTAAEVVNTASVTELADIIQRYGEDPKARQIAELIVGNRPITTTGQLATIVAKAWPGYSKVHPATRTFQALRIFVNDEIKLLEQSLGIWIRDLLAPGGRIAVISFHSLEDRLVKQTFQELGGDRYDALIRITTRRPVEGNDNEIASNPRARSAKLRAAVKQK